MDLGPREPFAVFAEDSAAHQPVRRHDLVQPVRGVAVNWNDANRINRVRIQTRSLAKHIKQRDQFLLDRGRLPELPSEPWTAPRCGASVVRGRQTTSIGAGAPASLVLGGQEPPSR